MKFITVFASLVTAAAAQNIAIGAPPDQATVGSGSNITVQVNRPNSLTGSKEVAIVISLAQCSSQPCDPNQRMGEVLYSGGFNPEYPPSPAPQDVPHQNFTVQVPSGIPAGQAALSVMHVALVGAGPLPLVEMKNVTLNVQ